MRKTLPDDRLLYQLAITEHVMHTRLDAELARFGLTITGYSVLLLVAYLPGISGSEIARRTLITQQAAARLATRLVELGYLAKAPDPKHARILKHKLTKAGRAALTAADELVEHWERKLKMRFGPRNSVRFRQQLDLVRLTFAVPIAASKRLAGA